MIAVDRIKNGNTAGSSGILPEMLKAGSNVAGFVHMLTDLVHAVWKEHKMPQEWENGILIPIPKKGNLHFCNNCRGIALLDVVGKVSRKNCAI